MYDVCMIGEEATVLKNNTKTSITLTLDLSDEAAVKAAPVPTEGRSVYRDKHLNPFVLRVYASGRRVFGIYARVKGGFRETGAPLDARFDNAFPQQLLDAFRGIPNTTPDEYQRLKDTVDFAVSSHHTEVGWQVPQRAQILPHVDRLQGLARGKGIIE